MAAPQVPGRAPLGGGVGVAPESGAYSIPGFCKAHGDVSRATFYTWQKKGLGPRLTRIEGRVLITQEDAAVWRKERAEASAAVISTNKQPGTPIAKSEAGLSVSCPPAK
jgi:hypothetical protein